MRNQIFHIFRKDIHHLSWEIVLSLAILVAYAWHESTGSMASEYPVADYSFPFQTLGLLVPVAWILLILRALQAESLVGDRQFWVTRPYEWKKLLVAKLLFVAVFVNAPLLVVEAFLLKNAGFPPTSHISGLLWIQLLWVLFVILPVVTLATVTASIGQFLLAVLGVMLYLIALPVLSSFIPAAGVSGVGLTPPSLGFLTVAGTSLVVVLRQYSTRRTAQSRIMLLGAAAVFLFIILATPYRALIEHSYPQATAGEQLSVQLAFDPVKPALHDRGYPDKNKVHVRIPLLVSGIATGSAVFVRGTMASVQAAGGVQWNGGWYGSGLVLLPNRQHAQTDITIDRDFFEQVKSTPLNVHITFALAPRHARETMRVVADAGHFAVPGQGRCSFSHIGPGEILCVFPMKSPFLLVSAKADETTCTPRENEPAPPAGTIGYGWIWTSGVIGGINPVHFQPLSLQDWGEVNPHEFRQRVCPGTPLTIFSNWEDSQPTRSELKIDGLRLVDYQLNDVLGGQIGFAIGMP